MENQKSFSKWMQNDPRAETLHTFFSDFHVMQRLIGNKVKDTGIYRSQHRMLMMLYWKPNITQVKIAQKLEVSPACVATMLKKLEQGGYIERKCSEDDTRANQIILSEKGNDVVIKSKETFKEIEDIVFKDFSDDEQKQLTFLLEKIAKNLKESEDGVV